MALLIRSSNATYEVPLPVAASQAACRDQRTLWLRSPQGCASTGLGAERHPDRRQSDAGNPVAVGIDRAHPDAMDIVDRRAVPKPLFDRH